jgi:hypothetical protein
VLLAPIRRRRTVFGLAFDLRGDGSSDMRAEHGTGPVGHVHPRPPRREADVTLAVLFDFLEPTVDAAPQDPDSR